MNISIVRATENDCHDLWLWRNNPQVRKWSFDDKEISYEEHENWFHSKLKSNNCAIYICKDDKGNKLGVIRFEKQDEPM